jgi:hypothetical protein
LPGLKRAKRVEVSEPAELPPDLLRYLWDWFEEISLGLSSDGFGPPLVTWEALAAWCCLTLNALEPWEATTLVRLGRQKAHIDSEPKPKGA